jgi:accessory gene regulator protein AgrB
VCWEFSWCAQTGVEAWLLYNRVNTKTEKEFNSPMLGFGPDITFSNVLELNVTYAIPLFLSESLSFSQEHPFINVDLIAVRAVE